MSKSSAKNSCCSPTSVSRSAKTLFTRASSINRALDQIGDKWCMLILQEVYWGINTFNDMLEATGASRGVLSDRLNWLQNVDCLSKELPADNPKRPIYHLTKKSLGLYANAILGVRWEREHFTTPELDSIAFIHDKCGKAFWPELRCVHCQQPVVFEDVFYHPGPGAKMDERETKVRRRSSIKSGEGSERIFYKNLINLIGDRWSANLIALSFHRMRRFDEFHKELPVATNILTDRLKFLVNEGIFYRKPYQQSPLRYEYHLTDRGRDLYPYFLALLQWGNEWCGDGDGDPMSVTHGPCNQSLHAEVYCDQCNEVLVASEVHPSQAVRELLD